MSDSNNNLNAPDCSRRWNDDIDIEFDDQLLFASYPETEGGRNYNSPVICDNEHDPDNVNETGPSHWGMTCSPGPSDMTDNPHGVDSECTSDSELEYLFEEPPPVHDGRFFNPNYELPAQVAGGDANTPEEAETTATGQANDSGLDLRPVPASIDLTRNRPPTTWRDYHARVRAQNRPPPGVQRLCAGQPPNRVPVFLDEELGVYVFVANDTDSEDEPTLPPLAMVPRRGNSVSDLSQCSSDEEPDKN